MTVERCHIERALAYEQHGKMPETTSLVASLWRAAVAFALEAHKRHRSNRTLPLDWADSLRGMILASASGRFSDEAEMLEAFGEEQMLRGRNHHKFLRREMDRARAFVGEFEVQDIPAELLLSLAERPSTRKQHESLLAESLTEPAQ
ncbi:MAG: hypothetical protein QM784_09565 [Polyangiaceae bacterium]